ncbi:TetR/AcrR family transcriptional regulator [Mycobacterium sp. DL440]|uniref:TetR/AcrR family transcriptional regulator n=1 Tax=Mycobacterium sp. DL440 TaxID=2675523 RepID=UPI001421DCDC|nr:TetR/AcrR family transcriptional regulator [Mycobacterium sp. DL440]
MTRTETAAATRRALLDEAAALLDAGGPAAVTLREVGARAGVSRGAPYGHFADKETLLTSVAAEGWECLGAEMQALHHDSGLSPAETLRAALLAVVALSRRRPHLYRLMFSPPLGDPEAIARAAQRMCDQFLAIVSAAAGEENANRHAAILLTAAHGACGLETSGLLDTDKWHTTADELIDSLLATIAEPGRRQ